MSKPASRSKGKTHASPPRTAFLVYQKLMRLHGTSVVLKELYQWFLLDRKTAGDEYSGLFNLLSKPEKEAVRVLDHINIRIAGGTEKAGMGWSEFVNPQPKKK